MLISAWHRHQADLQMAAAMLSISRGGAIFTRPNYFARRRAHSQRERLASLSSALFALSESFSDCRSPKPEHRPLSLCRLIAIVGGIADSGEKRPGSWNSPCFAIHGEFAGFTCRVTRQ